MHTDAILKSIRHSLEDESFYPQVFDAIAEKTQASRPDSILEREYVTLSNELEASQVQAGCTVRNVLKSRKLARQLIDQEGQLNDELVNQQIDRLQNSLHSLGPNRQHDSVRNEHMLNVLKLLSSDKELRTLLMKFSKPFNNQRMEQIIRDTLQLPPNESVTDAHTRQAALAAWLCYLRQNVGSCFGTAPAILIQTEEPHLFLQDLIDLVNVGQLKRTYAGQEHAVPMSLSWGAGDLRRQFMLARTPEESVTLPIWRSPGYHAALVAVDLLEENLRANEKSKIAKKLTFNMLESMSSDQAYILTSAEDVIRRVILYSLDLKEDDIKNYESRPKAMMPGTVTATPLGAKKGASTTARCLQFFSQLESAYSAFKSLSDQALLRIWEFTLASFTEAKASFSRWNLYTSLGFDSNQPGGIGECLYQTLNQKVAEKNQKVKELNEEYEVIYSQLKYMEMRVQRANSEQELKYLKNEYTAMRNEFRTFEQMRNKEHQKAQRYANLFADLIETYIELFPEYFQEVYDADLHEVDVGPYDDSPAGFRLLFKHGRPNPSAWTLVKTPEEYGDALSHFFTMSESRITSHPHFEGMENELSAIITSLVSHVKSTQFLESALHRLCQAHGQRLIKDPLKHLEHIEKKPWAYTSGGSMETLISAYFRRDEKPTEDSRWVENEIELLTFLVDCAKQLPNKALTEYLNDQKKSLLIHSPTHAFLLRPGLPHFKEAVKTDAYTYIWVRDHLQEPSEAFVEMLFLERDLMTILLDKLAKGIPDQIRYYFNSVFKDVPGKMRSYEFRNYVLDEISRYKPLQQSGMPIISADDIDSLLYKMLPFSQLYQIRDRIKTVLEYLPGIHESDVLEIEKLYEKIAGTDGIRTVLSACELKNVIMSLLLLHLGKSSTSYNYHLLVAKAMQKLGFSMPEPILFADSNWVTEYFGFVVNPGTADLELWRLDRTGMEGSPMSHWKKWVNGTQKKPDWGVYTNPYEYRL